MARVLPIWHSPPNQRIKLTAAAMLISRGLKLLQAAAAAYP
jgi:hypothetical protein